MSTYEKRNASVFIVGLLMSACAACAEEVYDANYPGDWRLLSDPAATGDVNAVAYAPDSKTYASGNQNGLISIWDAESGAKRQEMRHGGRVFGLAYSHDGRRLASCSGGVAKVWSLDDGRLIRSFPWQVDAVSDVEFSPDGERLYACAWRHWSEDQDIGPAIAVAWDVASGEVVGRYGTGRRNGYGLSLSPDGSRLLVVGGHVLLFDTRTEERIKTFGIGHYSANDVAFGSEGKLAIIATDEGVVVLDMETLSESHAYKYEYERDYIRGERTDDSGVVHYYLSGYDISSHKLTEVSLDVLASERRLSSVAAIAFGSTGDWFVTCDDQNIAVRWDLTTGEKLSEFSGRRFGVTQREVFITCTYLPETCVTVSPNGQRVLTGAPYGSTPHIITSGEDEQTFASSLILWDAATGAALHRAPRTMHGSVNDIAFAGDCKQLALSRRGEVIVLSTKSDAPTIITGGGMDIAFHASEGEQESAELLLASNNSIRQWDGDATTPVTGVDGVPWIWGGSIRLERGGSRYFTTPMLDRIEMFTIGNSGLTWSYSPPGKRGMDYEQGDSHGSGDVGPVIFARMSPDGSKVLVGHHPQGNRVLNMSVDYIEGICRLTLLDARDGAILHTLGRVSDLYADAVFSPNGRYLLVKLSALQTEDYPRSWTFELWDLEERSVLASFDREDGAWGDGPIFTVDSRRFLLGRSLRDAVTGDIVWSLGDAAEGAVSDLFRELSRDGIYSTEMSPDGKMLVTGHRHGRMAVWTTETGAPIAMIGFTHSDDDWYIVAADGRYDGTRAALETLFVHSPSGCRRLPDALPEFHETGLAGRLLTFFGLKDSGEAIMEAPETGDSD